MAMSPSSTVHGGQRDIKCVTFEFLMHAAFVADEIWGFTACLNQLVVGALARLGFGSSQSVTVSTACTYVARCLRVGISYVEKYRFTSILRCRSIGEASPLDDDVHSEIPVGIERSSAFHLVVGCRLRGRESACTRGWC